MRMNGADALLRSLEAEGVDTVFGIPGGAILPTYDALVDACTYNAGQSCAAPARVITLRSHLDETVDRLAAAGFLPQVGVPFPPLGDVLLTVYMYFLSQTLLRFRLLDLNDLYLTASTETERVDITSDLQAEIEHLVHERGFADLNSWVGTENYEMRVDPNGEWIDEKVLEILRSTGDDPGPLA